MCQVWYLCKGRREFCTIIKTIMFSEILYPRPGYENLHPSQSGFQLDLNIHRNVVHMSRQPQKTNDVKGKPSICEEILFCGVILIAFFRFVDKKKSSPIIGSSDDEVLNEFLRLYRSANLELVPKTWASANASNLRQTDEEISVYQSLKYGGRLTKFYSRCLPANRVFFQRYFWTASSKCDQPVTFAGEFIVVVGVGGRAVGRTSVGRNQIGF